MKNYLENLSSSPASIVVLALIMVAAVASAPPLVQPPTLTITAPRTGAKWSNDVYLVTGNVTKGSLAVSNVLVSVNAGAWATATVSNHTWKIQVNLTAGTNTIAAYAGDIGGHHSSTNRVKLLYVITAPFTLQIVGEGVVTPNLNGHAVDIGVNYTLQAKGTNGFAFYYWSGGVPMSTNSKVTFTMVQGLSITANFWDVTPPTLAITAPKTGEQYSNSTITVTGTAHDNMEVAAVEVQINGTGWVTATGTNAWSANLPVLAGKNIVEAYAMDEAGNCSKTNEVTFAARPPGWDAPTTLTQSLLLMTPFYPGTGPMHYLCFSQFGTTNFTYSDTNSGTLTPDSGVGHYRYSWEETNYSVVTLEFNGPPALDNLTATISLEFTNLGAGIYINNYTLEYGNFLIEAAPYYFFSEPSFKPPQWTGKSYVGIPFGAANEEFTLTFTSASTFKLLRNHVTYSGTYSVDPASTIGMVFTAEITSTPTPRTLYLQATFTDESGGFFEDNEYMLGKLQMTTVGTFRKAP